MNAHWKKSNGEFLKGKSVYKEIDNDYKWISSEYNKDKLEKWKSDKHFEISVAGVPEMYKKMQVIWNDFIREFGGKKINSS